MATASRCIQAGKPREGGGGRRWRTPSRLLRATIIQGAYRPVVSVTAPTMGPTRNGVGRPTSARPYKLQFLVSTGPSASEPLPRPACEAMVLEPLVVVPVSAKGIRASARCVMCHTKLSRLGLVIVKKQGQIGSPATPRSDVTKNELGNAPTSSGNRPSAVVYDGKPRGKGKH